MIIFRNISITVFLKINAILQCANVNVAVKKLECSLLQSEQQETEKSKNELLGAAKDVLSDWLDSLYKHTVSDLAVFDRLAKKLALFILFISDV